MTKDCDGNQIIPGDILVCVDCNSDADLNKDHLYEFVRDLGDGTILVNRRVTHSLSSKRFRKDGRKL